MMNNKFKFFRPVGNQILTVESGFAPPKLLNYPVYYCNSGTAALAAAIIAVCKLKPDIKKPEVILPAYSCPDLISAIIYANATPVLIDLMSNSPEMSHQLIKESITDRTTAIITVRFFGITKINHELYKLAKQNKLIVIEDSAQGFPSIDDSSYWSGDFIILSFGRGKPVNLLGGGAVLSRNPELMKLLPPPATTLHSISDKIKYKLKLFIYNISIHPIAYGLISKLPGLTLGQTIYKTLNGIKNINADAICILNANIRAYKTRRNCQKKYHTALQLINSTKIIDLPGELNHDMSQPLLRYPILIKNATDRNKLYQLLKPYGASTMYKQPLHRIDNVYKDVKKSNSNYPNACRFADQLITLPTHEGMDDATLNIIKDALKGF